jgi:hypothetical protein
MKTFFRYLVWFIATFGLFSICCTALTASSTIANLFGFCIGAIWCYITVSSNFLKKYFKDEENC